jgi:leader peptidase (prepilin peptidase) / N-methyltransferase
VNIPDLIIGAIVLINGAAIGSFLNVVIYRIPAGLSVVSPPSRCPTCLNKLGPGENIPVLGWLLLRGKCRHCKTPISVRYPLVEAATALLFLAVYLTFGLSIQTVGYCLFLAWLLALSLIDIDTMTLPNVLTKSLLIVGLVYQAIAGYVATHTIAGVADRFSQGIWGMLLGIWLYDGIRFFASGLFNREAQGGGDAKLMAGIGAWLGWKFVLLTGFLASGLGTLIIGIPMFIQWSIHRFPRAIDRPGAHVNRFQHFPLGPFIALGATICLFAGDRILIAYTEFGQSTDRHSLSVMFIGSTVALCAWVLWVWKRRQAST